MKKFILPISILLGCIILGWFLYAGIERQQEIKTLQDKREYIGKRRMECYNILEKEKGKNDYAISVEYFEPSSNSSEGKDFDDACRVKYFYYSQDGSYTDYMSF